MEAEIQKVGKRGKESQRQTRRTTMTRTQICREPLKNPKKPRREKSGQESPQKSCREQTSLERRRSSQLEEMILISVEAVLPMLEMLTTSTASILELMQDPKRRRRMMSLTSTLVLAKQRSLRSLSPLLEAVT